MEKVIKYS